MTTAIPGQNDPYGIDVAIALDMDPSGRSAYGVELVSNAILHRLTTDTLLLVGAPDDRVDFGVDVRQWVGEVTTQANADAKGPLIAIVIQRDPRIDPSSILVAVTVLPIGALYRLEISVTCRTTTALPVALVIGVNAISVDLLSQGR